MRSCPRIGRQSFMAATVDLRKKTVPVRRRFYLTKGSVT